MPAILTDRVFGSHILGPWSHAALKSHLQSLKHLCRGPSETLTNNVSHITISIFTISYGNGP